MNVCHESGYKKGRKGRHSTVSRLESLSPFLILIFCGIRMSIWRLSDGRMDGWMREKVWHVTKSMRERERE